jgi:hypothetical protein
MQLIDVPSLITAAGAPPKLIAENVGRLNTGGLWMAKSPDARDGLTPILPQ